MQDDLDEKMTQRLMELEEGNPKPETPSVYLALLEEVAKSVKQISETLNTLEKMLDDHNKRILTLENHETRETEPVQIEATTEPGNVEPGNVEPGNVEPGNAEPGKRKRRRIIRFRNG